MKNIVIILPSLKGVSPIFSAFHLAKILLNEGFSLSVVSISSLYEGEISQGLDQYGIPCYSLNLRRGLGFFRARSKLQKLLITLNPDVVVSYLFLSDLMLASLRLRVPKVASMRNMVGQEYSSQYGFLKSRVMSFVHMQALRRLNYLIVMSDSMREYFLSAGFPEEKLKTIYNCLDEGLVCKKALEKGMLEISNGPPVFITASSLIKRKNVRFLLDVFFSIYKEGIECYLILVGDGDQGDELKEYVGKEGFLKYVKFLGRLTNPLPVFRQADFYVSSSLSEGISRSVMEALFLGKPGVLLNIPGASELICEDVNGYVCNGAEEMRLAILKIISESRIGSRDAYLPDKFREISVAKSAVEFFDGLVKVKKGRGSKGRLIK